MIDINRNPSARDQLWFAVLLAVFLGGVGALLKWHWGQDTAAYVVWGAGGLALLAFAVVPAWRVPLYVGWIMLFYPLGFVLSHVMLALVYYLVLTPSGLLLRLFGRDPMRRRWEPDANTYWIEREPIANASRYFRQY